MISSDGKERYEYGALYVVGVRANGNNIILIPSDKGDLSRVS